MMQALMMMLGAALVFIVGNTLRVTVQKRQEEIKILKLVGATDPYIARPFLYSGMLIGLGGAICCVLLVNLFLLSVSSVLGHVLSLYHVDSVGLGLSLGEIGYLILSAIFLGWIGAFISIKQQLAYIDPAV